MKKNCECCNIIIIPLGSQKYCTNCSIYTINLRKGINNLKQRIKYLQQKTGNYNIKKSKKLEW